MSFMNVIILKTMNLNQIWEIHFDKIYSLKHE